MSTEVMTAPRPATPRDELDRALGFARRAARFHRPALVLFLTGVAATMVVAAARQRAYRSETVLEYREALGAAGESGGDPARRLGLRLKESLLSRARLQPLIKELNLYPERNQRDAVEEMARHLGLRVAGGTFTLSFDAAGAETARTVVARLADGLIAESATAQREQATQSRDFLQGETALNDAALAALEADAGQFMLRHPEFGRSGPLAASLIPTAEAEIAAADRPRDDGGALLAVQLEAAQAGPLASLQGPRLERRRAAEAVEQATARELADKLALYTESHPDVMIARRAHEQASALLANARSEVDAAAPEALRERLAAVSRLGGQGGSGSRRRTPSKAVVVDAAEEQRLVALQTRWAQLGRDVAEARERRTQLTQKLFLSSLAVSSVSTHLAIVDPAFLPRDPLPPGRALVIGIGVLVALLLSLVLAGGGALLDDRLHCQRDIVRLDVGPINEALPAQPPPEDDLVDEGGTAGALPQPLRRLVAPSDSPQSAAYRVLRFRLGAAGDPRIIAVTSAQVDEGSMECAVNLAVAIAEQGQSRVVIIDGNARERSAFEVSPRPPLVLLSDGREPRPPADGAIHVYSPQARPGVLLRLIELPRPAPGESIDGAAFAEVCRELLEDTCDYVVIAAPPVLGSADANVLAQAADGVVIAAHSGHSTSRSVRRAANQLVPIHVLGIALLPA